MIMETQTNNTTQVATEAIGLTSAVKSAQPLTLLQLNDIRLDVKHTILTPQYLEQIDSK